MDRNIGVWIDHKQAYLIWYETGQVDVIPSNVEPSVRPTGGVQTRDSELRRNDRYRLQLSKFYRQVIARLNDAGSLFIMGPGEAKVELEKMLKKHKSLQARLRKVETADKMTKNQMIAHVKKFYKSQADA